MNAHDWTTKLIKLLCWYSLVIRVALPSMSVVIIGVCASASSVTQLISNARDHPESVCLGRNTATGPVMATFHSWQTITRFLSLRHFQMGRERERKREGGGETERKREREKERERERETERETERGGREGERERHFGSLLSFAWNSPFDKGR